MEFYAEFHILYHFRRCCSNSAHHFSVKLVPVITCLPCMSSKYVKKIQNFSLLWIINACCMLLIYFMKNKTWFTGMPIAVN